MAESHSRSFTRPVSRPKPLIHKRVLTLRLPLGGLRFGQRARPRRPVTPSKEFLFEGFRIADDMLTGRDFFFDHFTTADAHFFWCTRRALQFNLNLSGFPNC